MIMDDAVIEAIVSKLLEIRGQENVNIPLYERELWETNINIENMLNAIFLYDDKLMLGLNFHEGTTTITFDDLQETIKNEGFGSDLNSVGALHARSRKVSGIFVRKNAGWKGLPNKREECRRQKQEISSGLRIWIFVPFFWLGKRGDSERNKEWRKRK